MPSSGIPISSAPAPFAARSSHSQQRKVTESGSREKESSASAYPSWTVMTGTRSRPSKGRAESTTTASPFSSQLAFPRTETVYSTIAPALYSTPIEGILANGSLGSGSEKNRLKSVGTSQPSGCRPTTRTSEQVMPAG